LAKMNFLLKISILPGLKDKNYYIWSYSSKILEIFTIL